MSAFFKSIFETKNFILFEFSSFVLSSISICSSLFSVGFNIFAKFMLPSFSWIMFKKISSKVIFSIRKCFCSIDLKILKLIFNSLKKTIILLFSSTNLKS